MRRTIRSLAIAAAVGLAAAPLAAQAKQLVLGFSSVGLSFPFASAIAKGFQDAAAEVGAKTIVLDAKAQVQKQANDVDDLIAQKVDGIAVHPLDSTVAQGWMDRAADAKIVSVAVASQVGDPAKRPIKQVYEKMAALVTQDEIAAGERAGELAARLLPKGREAKIAVIEGAAGFAEVRQRSEGFFAGLKKAGAKYRVVASQPGDWSPEKGEAACQNILASSPDVDFLFNQADDMVIGCARAVRSAGSQAHLIGMGGSKLAINALKGGDIDGTVCYKPEVLGRLAFQALYETITGKRAHKAEFITYDTPAVSKDNVSQCVPQW